MGMSQSSSGSPSGVPMVPPWTPDADAPEDGLPPGDDAQPVTDSNQAETTDEAQETPTPAPSPSPVAPQGRFRGTRISLGNFGQSGGRQNLQRGIGRYVGHGLGGSGTAARRFGGTARTAGTLFNTLSGAATDRASELARRVDVLFAEGADAHQLIDAVVEAV